VNSTDVKNPIKNNVTEVMPMHIFRNRMLNLFDLFVDELFKGGKTPTCHYGQEVLSYFQLLLGRENTKTNGD
jgi:hypothetical protein